MKQARNILLGTIFVLCLYLLLMQGFAAPTLSGFAELLLRIAAAVSIQLLLCHTGKKPALRALPLALTALLAIWGFFLLLTAPSWQYATLWRFLADYVSPVFGCIAAWLIYRKR